MKEWIPTMIAGGALALTWFLIRRMIEDLKKTVETKMDHVWSEIHKIKETYMQEDKHALICGKSALEIEKLFKQWLRSPRG